MKSGAKKRSARASGGRLSLTTPSGGNCQLKQVLLIVSAALAVTACASVPAPATTHWPEARPYHVSDTASADVDAALARAQQSGKRVLLVMGANWCSDSRALAGWLATDRFVELIERKYELVYVDIGMPGPDRPNVEIARRFGVAELPGSPNVLVLMSDGALVNPTTATTWRNAESRTADAIYDELATLADLPVSPGNTH
jgi:thiol:disulfide interchange protein